MRTLIIALAIGIISGIIDILPMIKMKLGKHAILSAFVFYLIMPSIVYHTNLFDMPWWIKGSVITLLLATPTIIVAAKGDQKSTLPMVSMALLLGALIGVSEHFLIGPL